MAADRWDRIQELFDSAMQLPEERRKDFVHSECSEDPEIREEVLSLLNHQSEGFLSPDKLDRFLPEAQPAGHPEEIDEYKIVSVLGEGGMGIVYQAEQSQPVPRTVALKLLKFGMNTHEVVARFNTERRALALMSHPNIAQVFGAGATEDGRPYFAMEYVDGQSITSYCDEHGLDLRERLELFAQVCDGIQHAHQKGIVHRDIKPSNVLVTTQDGRPTPKIIDFGIAKATDPNLLKSTIQTEMGQLIGTLAYMSPEQLRFSGDDIDTRTDVYSAGALLYELLAGSVPFDTGAGRLAFDEVCRHIRETDPPRPSSRSGSSGLMRELDWVVMKALEKDRARRYSGAAEFAADVRRVLRHEPVIARPPDVGYRVRKFLRRHRIGVVFAGMLVGVLLAGIVSTSTAMLRALRAEREAVAVADYLVDVFRAPRTGHADGKAVTALEILDAKSAEIREDLTAEPGPRGRFMVAMAEAYINLAEYEKALSLLEDALPLLRDAYGNEHPEVFNALNESGRLANELKDPAGAKAYFLAALPLAEKAMGRNHANVATILKNLGDSCKELGELKQARSYLQRALTIRMQAFGPASPRLAPALSSLAALASELGDHDSAAEMAARSLEIRSEAFEAGDPRLAFGHYAYAGVLTAATRDAEAEQQIDAAIAIYRGALGAEHPNVADCLLDRARIRRNLGRLDEAYSDYRAARTIHETAYAGADGRLDPALGASLAAYAEFLDQLGRSEEAEQTRQQARRLAVDPS